MSQNNDNRNTSRFQWGPEQPYDGLPGLSPQVDLETRAVLKACVGARAALAELKQGIGLLPDPGILLASLPLLEARASSEVEDVVTTADELFRRVEDEGRADSATREALRYRAALLEGFRSIQARPLGLGTARHVCSRIKDADMDVRRVPGVRIGNPRTGQVVYPPPTDPAILGELVSNWEAFLHAKDDLDPLVRMAVAHYQFEAIHPFTDGNGRTGRVLNSLFLVERGLIGAPILYLSRYVIDHKAEYYDRLLGVTREGAWEPWILFVVEAVEETSRWTLHKVEAIARLHGATRDFLRAGLPRIYSAELVEELFLRPYCRIRHLVAAGLGGRQTASRHLKALAEVGILVEQQEGRDKVFVQPRLLRLLTTEANDFAALD